ncbi:hypothetical protein ADIS_1991 [Lunatimonas lonarensis]|uniref:Uncharacterized protein n=1 Tax=Lunatimonas lonarensis TaxID=1232681 RepID=R7ZTI7_9BACT|nr:hypothetical protein ADIS_1991 [Lunatimonas lonarensis]
MGGDRNNLVSVDEIEGNQTRPIQEQNARRIWANQTNKKLATSLK